MLVLLFRTFLFYIVIIVSVRIMGKRQLGQMQTTELVGMLLISDLASIPIQDTSLPLHSGLVPVAVLICCEIAASIFLLRCPRIRRALCGRPVVVIDRGKIRQKEMRTLRMSVEELFELLRQKNVKNVEEVAFAIVETNGLLSVIRNAADDPATPRQLQLKTEDPGLSVVVIDDGAWRENSLRLCGKDRAWGERVLKKEKLALQDVFLMTADAAGNTHIVKKEKR